MNQPRLRPGRREPEEPLEPPDGRDRLDPEEPRDRVDGERRLGLEDRVEGLRRDDEGLLDRVDGERRLGLEDRVEGLRRDDEGLLDRVDGRDDDPGERYRLEGDVPRPGLRASGRYRSLPREEERPPERLPGLREPV